MYLRPIKKRPKPRNSRYYTESSTSDSSDEDLSSYNEEDNSEADEINATIEANSEDSYASSESLDDPESTYESVNINEIHNDRDSSLLKMHSAGSHSTSNSVIFIKVTPYKGPDSSQEETDQAASANQDLSLTSERDSLQTDLERFSDDQEVKKESEIQVEKENNRITRSKRIRKKNPKYDNPDIDTSMFDQEDDQEEKTVSTKEKKKRVLKEGDPYTYDYPCIHCEAKFRKNFHYRFHLKKVHSVDVENLPKLIRNSTNKKLPFKCSICSARFKQNSYLKGHLKNMHSMNVDDTRPRVKHRCPICSAMCLKAEIHKHLEDKHDIFLNNKKLKFSSVEEFEHWKLTEEKETRSMYRQLRSCIQSGKRYKYYICHRSGDYISNSKGHRQMKVKGSNKINGYCPASITSVVNQNGECEVTYVPNHVGHENDALYLPLSQDVKEIIAFKIAMNVPFNVILKEVKSYLSETDPERSRLLTRKDLHNISSSVFLHKLTHPTDESAERTESGHISKDVLHVDYEELIKMANQGANIDTLEKALKSLKQRLKDANE